MKLRIGQAHTLLIGLKAMENDKELKLAGDTWIKIATIITALEPKATAYERASQRMLADLIRASRDEKGKPIRSDAEWRADHAEEDNKLREAELDIDLPTLLKADLRLSDNPGLRLSAILPIIEDAKAA